MSERVRIAGLAATARADPRDAARADRYPGRVDDPKRLPGMDPWLEDPALWPGVHHYLITYLAEDLAPKIRPRYTARPGEREVLELFERAVVPDVAVTLRDPDRAPDGGPEPEEAAAPVVVKLRPHEVREPYLELRDARSGAVVTVVEVLSPANKRAGSDSRRKYAERQEQLLAAAVNLVEIDLLRGGAHAVALPEESVGSLPRHHYRVVVRRAAAPEDVEVYPIALPSRLPRVRIPLREPDGDVTTDLQALLDRAYDVGGYGLDVDYDRDPSPPLGADDLAWARGVLSADGAES